MLPKILGLLRFWEKHTVAPHVERVGGGPVFANGQNMVGEIGFRYLQLNAMATWDFAVAGAD
jgi:hypothetical protein